MCPSAELLHRLADGFQVEADVRLHVDACEGCQVHLQSLQHLDHWLGQAAPEPILDGGGAAGPSAEEILSAAMSGQPRRLVALPVIEEASYSERLGGPVLLCASVELSSEFEAAPVAGALSATASSERPARMRHSALAAAAVILAGLTIGGLWLRSAHSNPGFDEPAHSAASKLRVTQAGAKAPLTLLQSLAASDPRLVADVSSFRAAILMRIEKGDDIRGQLDRAWAQAGSVQDRLRLARVASEIKLSHLAMRAKDLLREDLSPAEARHGLLTLGRLGTNGAIRALKALRNRGVGAAIDFVDALVATGSPAVADRLWNLLADCGLDEDVAFEYLNRLPGRSVARILAEQWRAGARSSAVESFIAQRPAALDELRRAYSELGAADRVSLLALLGSAGDRRAVPLLDRHLKKGRSFAVAAEALARVALAGSDPAFQSLAEAIKSSENPQAGAGALLPSLVAALRSIGPAATDWGRRVASDTTQRASLRRRALIVVGLTGTRSDLNVREELESYLDQDCFVRAALAALAHLGSEDSVAAVAKFANSRNRSHRLTALSALCVIGGEASAQVLASSLGHSSTRRSIMEWLRPVEQSWVVPVLIEGLKYRNSHRECLKRLQQTFGARAPQRTLQSSPKAWKDTWLDAATEDLNER